jgi:hypothetical protein
MLPRFGDLLAPTPDFPFIADNAQHSASLVRRPNTESSARGKKTKNMLRCPDAAMRSRHEQNYGSAESLVSDIARSPIPRLIGKPSANGSMDNKIRREKPGTAHGFH